MSPRGEGPRLRRTTGWWVGPAAVLVVVISAGPASPGSAVTRASVDARTRAPVSAGSAAVTRAPRTPPAGPAATRRRGGRPTQAPPLPGSRPPSAWAVADIHAGVILAGENAHRPMPPASTIKLLTALVVRDHLEPDTRVEVSRRAATRPALKLNLRPGERWRVSNLLRAMLLCSCNDAAYALAEAVGDGDLATFARRLSDKAAELGLGDDPVLGDPAGLDAVGGYRGGNRISAADLVIVGAAVLDDPVLARIVTREKFRWRGGDGERHVVYGHNPLIGSYPGATGLKTGYTDKAGATLVASAARQGRRIVAVLLDSPNTRVQAPALLDLGVATSPAEAEGPLGRDDPAPPTTSTTGSATTSTTGPDGTATTEAEPPTSSPTAHRQGDSPGPERAQASPAPASATSPATGNRPPLRLLLAASAAVAMAVPVVLVLAARRRVTQRRNP